MQDRRSGIAGVSRMVGIQNQALDTARVNAENQRNQRFGQLGGATQMQSAEDRRLFQQNVLSPYERRLQLANMKAQGATNVFNAGMSNLAGAGSTAAMMNMRKSDTMGADSYRKNLPDMKVGSLPTEMANYAAQQSTADMPSGIANTFPNEIRNTLLLHPSFRTKSY
ncbi:MAG: hypothetical protein K8R85_01530 [Bacteroidetes bacterium]|nr:hypothetical protein [Bacteroidota bacterium]